MVLEAQRTLLSQEVIVRVGTATSATRFGGEGVLAHEGSLSRF